MWRWKRVGLTLQRYGNNDKYSYLFLFPTIGKLIDVKSGSLASGSSRKKRTKKKTHTERISSPGKQYPWYMNQKVIIESEYHFCQ